MKILPYYDFNILNEIKLGATKPYDFVRNFSYDPDYNSYYIEFEYTNEKKVKKIVSVDFSDVEAYKFILEAKPERNINDYLLQFDEKIDGIITHVSFDERKKGKEKDDTVYSDNVDNQNRFRKEN